MQERGFTFRRERLHHTRRWLELTKQALTYFIVGHPRAMSEREQRYFIAAPKRLIAETRSCVPRSGAVDANREAEKAIRDHDTDAVFL